MLENSCIGLLHKMIHCYFARIICIHSTVQGTESAWGISEFSVHVLDFNI